MNDIGRTKKSIIYGSDGSIYVLLPVFLVLILLLFSLLIFALRLIILSHDIDHAFERCGADLFTAIRKENYDAMSEANIGAIDTRINNPSDNTVREKLLSDFIRNLTKSLDCNLDWSNVEITKLAATAGDRNKTIFRISNFSFSYTMDIGNIRAIVEIPIIVFDNNIMTYSKELCYEFAISSK